MSGASAAVALYLCGMVCAVVVMLKFDDGILWPSDSSHDPFGDHVMLGLISTLWPVLIVACILLLPLWCVGRLARFIVERTSR